MKIERIVLNIPHSAPLTDLSAWSDQDAIRAEADKWTDLHTAILFSAPGNPAVVAHTAALSRYVVDMERLPDDPMESQGQGILYSASKDGKSVRTFRPGEREELLESYRNYHAELSRLTTVPGTLLIDCHSFPSDFAEAGNASGNPVDVCIGFNTDGSEPPDRVKDIVRTHFELQGWTVGVNSPFSNSIVGATGCPSIMIELNKRLYMNEINGNLRPDGYKIGNVINLLYGKLIGAEVG